MIQKKRNASSFQAMQLHHFHLLKVAASQLWNIVGVK